MHKRREGDIWHLKLPTLSILLHHNIGFMKYINLHVEGAYCLLELFFHSDVSFHF